MTYFGMAQIATLTALIALLTKPLGSYMDRVFAGLISQGVPQTLDGLIEAITLEGGKQLITRGFRRLMSPLCQQ
jgi:K+-transporting ATPase A subunit